MLSVLRESMFGESRLRDDMKMVLERYVMVSIRQYDVNGGRVSPL
ncbi:hypothetical protein LKI_02260 [Leuconostoc kimchii IMSNU 11154]|uniref:Uncharacterized protein n=1 Tax=Leuconostoc kimchii (strain IMSNU 11154 / KCTC 2386 / IH25) TaxID=762051 RepID=D5T146_LEUKI|nr:hypothetical protein LKI_02260 [Leuconostoc kimchii IMSNU 11154]